MRSMSLIAALLITAACSGDGNSGNGGTADARVGGVIDAPLGSDAGMGTVDARPAGGTDGGGLVNDAGQPLCADKTLGTVVCQCSDGKNNDSDSLIDAADPECVGPYDNDESSYATGIPGDNSDPYAQDCFFDGDSGGGNDGCRWDIRCEAPPNGQHCNNNQLTGCDKCRPLVPNGCDCFGCCDVYVNGVVHTVRIIETCSTAVIDDPSKCPTCTKVTGCENPCGMCEECLGRPPDPSCTSGDGGVNPGMCPVGVTPCAEPDNTCPPEYKCVTGCCVKYLSKQ